jgi:hypothetical protein
VVYRPKWLSMPPRVLRRSVLHRCHGIIMHVSSIAVIREFETSLISSGKYVLIRHIKKEDQVRYLKKADLHADFSANQVCCSKWASSCRTHDRARHRYGLGVCQKGRALFFKSLGTLSLQQSSPASLRSSSFLKFRGAPW